MVQLTYAHLVLFCAITGSGVVASPLPTTFDSRGTNGLDRVQSSKSYNLDGLESYQPRDYVHEYGRREYIGDLVERGCFPWCRPRPRPQPGPRPGVYNG